MGGRGTRDFTDVDVPALDAELGRRLGWAERRIDLPAGRYETLLPPTAVADLLIYQYWSSIARDAVEGRTVFSKPGGGTRVGEKLTDVPLRMRSDPAAPGLESAPFVVAATSGAAQSVFDNGLPLDGHRLDPRRQLTALIQTRHSAATDRPARHAVRRQPARGVARRDRALDEMVARPPTAACCSPASGTSARSTRRPCCSPGSPATASTSSRAARWSAR